jgi:hypothetical protein
MRRSILLVFLVSILIVFASRIASACDAVCQHTRVTATPNTGPAPLSVVVNGTIGWVPVVDMDLGGEAMSEWEFPWNGDYMCRGISAQHQFECPGMYTIKVFEHGFPNDAMTTTVTVTPPSTPYLFVYSGNSANQVYLATHYYAAERPFTSVSVEWGDGAGETFAWTPRGLYMGTPYHQYAADGEYTATVTHHYQYQYCSWDQVSTIVVKVPVPTTATRPTTWGVVKAMYR